MVDEIIELVNLNVVRLQQLVDVLRSFLLVFVVAQVLLGVYPFVRQTGLRPASLRDLPDKFVNWQLLQGVYIELEVPCGSRVPVQLLIVIIPVLVIIIPILIRTHRAGPIILCVLLHTLL